MISALALAGSLSTAAILIGAIVYLRRSLTIVRQLSFVLLVGAVAASMEVYKFAGGALPADFEKIYTWVVVFGAAVTALRLLGLYVFDVHLRARRGLHLAPMLAPATQGLAYLITAFVLLRVLFPEIDLAPLLATSAVTSLVLGLALQPILANLFAGIVISLEQPFRLDDWVRVDQIEGRVVQITWRTTHIRTRNNDNLIIPNARMAEQDIINYYYPNQMHLTLVHVGVSYTAPPYRVRRALTECAVGVDGTLEKPSPDVFVKDFGDSSITYELRVWIRDVADELRIKSELTSRIWESFKRHDITIPFPIRTLEFAPRRKAVDRSVATPAARLFITEGAGAGETLRLADRPLVIGRDASADLQLADAQASKAHARIEWTDEGHVIVDLESTFGTLVNNARVDRRILQAMDRITIGSTVLVFESDGA